MPQWDLVSGAVELMLLLLVRDTKHAVVGFHQSRVESSLCLLLRRRVPASGRLLLLLLLLLDLAAL